MNARLMTYKRDTMARVFLALVMLLALIAVAPARPVTAQQAVAPRTVTLSDITDDPAAFVGQRITVRGDLVEVFGPGAFRLDDDAFFGGDSLLVFGANRNVAPFAGEGTWDAAIGGNINMQVTGEVRILNRTFADEAGYDFDTGLYDAYDYDGLYDSYEGQAAIVATSTEVVATLSDVADNTDAYMGLAVTIYGDIVDVVSPTAFQLDDPGVLGFDTVLVVAANQDVIPVGNNLFNPSVFDTVGAQGVSALVHGRVRSNDRLAIEDEVGYDLDDNLLRDYAEDAVLVADTVRPDISLSDIADNPEAFNGLRVSIVGDVVDRVGRSAFQLDDEALLGFDTLLVVPTNGIAAPAADDVRVNGIVRTFDQVLIEDEIGYDLVDGEFDTYTDRPVVIARSVVPLAE
jgi:hypothetical protein